MYLKHRTFKRCLTRPLPSDRQMSYLAGSGGGGVEMKAENA